jgi:8-oxo-dGTP pyrophosphatase MutT (NUDIX family)
MMAQDIKTATFDPGDGQLPYRLGVLLVVFNRRGEIFIGKSNKPTPDGLDWQLPQGGMKMLLTEGMLHRERASDAARREMREELGTGTQFDLVKIMRERVTYEFPDANPKYRGQMLIPVLVRCHNNAAGFDINRPEEGDGQPAFSAWKWAKPAEVLRNVTTAKTAAYMQVMEAFKFPINASTMSQNQRRDALAEGTPLMVRPNHAAQARQRLQKSTALYS